jgi:hypothetical protein
VVNNYSILEEEGKTWSLNRVDESLKREGYILDISPKANFEAPFKNN